MWGTSPGSGQLIWGGLEGNSELGVSTAHVSQLSHHPGMNRSIEPLRQREKEGFQGIFPTQGSNRASWAADLGTGLGRLAGGTAEAECG